MVMLNNQMVNKQIKGRWHHTENSIHPTINQNQPEIQMG